MKLNKTDRQRRTKAFLKNWRGTDREFDHLHGVLCLSHGWTTGESLELSKIIDTTMIAERLDEIIRAQKSHS